MELKSWLAGERGRAASLARQLGVAQPVVSDWCTGKKDVPLSRCVQIEVATSGVVTRRDLRPGDWREHWPELAAADTQGAVHA